MNNEELYKEAKEYVRQNYCDMCVMADDCESGCIDCFTVQAYIASAEPREKRIAELEKENAELKDDNKVMADNYSKTEQKFYNNLAEAKKYIRELARAVEHSYSVLNWQRPPIKTEAEQVGESCKNNE